MAAILSAAMLLQYSLCRLPEARAIEKAVSTVIDSGFGTADIGGKSSTAEVGDAIAKELEKLLKA